MREQKIQRFKSLKINNKLFYSGVLSAGGGITVVSSAESLSTPTLETIATIPTDTSKTNELIVYKIYFSNDENSDINFSKGVIVASNGEITSDLTKSYVGDAWVAAPSVTVDGTNLILKTTLESDNYASVVFTDNVYMYVQPLNNGISLIDIDSGGQFISNIVPDVFPAGTYLYQFDTIDNSGIKWRFKGNTVTISSPTMDFSNFIYILYDVDGADTGPTEVDFSYVESNFTTSGGAAITFTNVYIFKAPGPLSTIVTYESLGN